MDMMDSLRIIELERTASIVTVDFHCFSLFRIVSLIARYKAKIYVLSNKYVNKYRELFDTFCYF